MLPAWVERFRQRADAANLTLTLTLDSPPLIIGDAGRLDQVVSNLIDNAIHYNNPGGSVQVHAGRDTRVLTSAPAKAASVLVCPDSCP